MECMEAKSQISWFLQVSHWVSSKAKNRNEVSLHHSPGVFSGSLEQTGSQRNIKRFTNIKLAAFMSISQIEKLGFWRLTDLSHVTWWPLCAPGNRI